MFGAPCWINMPNTCRRLCYPRTTECRHPLPFTRLDLPRTLLSWVTVTRSGLAILVLGDRRFGRRDRYYRPHARARRKALSRPSRVSSVAASNSRRASASRPARNRKSPSLPATAHNGAGPAASAIDTAGTSTLLPLRFCRAAAKARLNRLQEAQKGSFSAM